MVEYYKGVSTIYQVNCSAVRNLENEEDRKCLEQRKYWCFLLSSIATFCACMLLVLTWRLILRVCCRPKEKDTFEEGVEDETDGPISGNKGTKRRQEIIVEELSPEVALIEGPPPQAQTEEIKIGTCKTDFYGLSVITDKVD